MIQSLIAGRYRVLALLGAGGEAQVFRARDERDGSEVALRVGRERARPLESPPPLIVHDRWVRLLHAGEDATHGAYQIFELLEGRTLAEIIAQGPLPPTAWQNFVAQSLDAVAAIHDAHAAHGDLNADNFLLTATGWKLLELPFHRFSAPKERSALFGSIHTLGPEQINGAPPSVGSDLYSLGCLYYYAAAGSWPHRGSTVSEIAIERLMRPATPLREIAPSWPIAWSNGVMKLLATKPSDRFLSAAAARQMLADAVA